MFTNRAKLARTVHHIGTACAYIGLAACSVFPVMLALTWSGLVDVSTYGNAAPLAFVAMVGGQLLMACGAGLWTRADTIGLRARIAGVR